MTAPRPNRRRGRRRTDFGRQISRAAAQLTDNTAAARAVHNGTAQAARTCPVIDVWRHARDAGLNRSARIVAAAIARNGGRTPTPASFGNVVRGDELAAAIARATAPVEVAT